jgi:HAMP domain-containing protein
MPRLAHGFAAKINALLAWAEYILGGMETLLLAFAIAVAIVALVLYFELKNTQERVEKIRTEIEQRMSLTIQNAMHDTSEKIPQIEKRVEEIAQKVAETEAEVHSMTAKNNAPQQE